MDDVSLGALVLREITPSPDAERKVHEAACALMDEVRAAAAQMGLKVEPLLVGSVAKGTFLSEPDIDLFVPFPPATPREALEQQGLALAMKVLPRGLKQYAEHPYVKGRYRGFEAEVVPCYSITDATQKMSAVDRTPFHTTFILANLKEAQKGQVRLLKRFLKGIGAYGAEEAVRGFSGYLAELLVLRFGDFHRTLEAAARWPEAVRLELEGAASPMPVSSERGSTDPSAPATAARPFQPRGIVTKGEPLVFVDPVDPSRNVASALSTEKYTLFIHAAGAYLAEPDRRFFFPADPNPMPMAKLFTEARRRGTMLVGIKVRTPKVLPDIYCSQLRKFERGVRTLCEEHGFLVLHSGFREQGKDTLFLFEFEVASLPEVRGHRGPPVGNPREKEFIAKWRASPHRRSALHIHDGLWAVDVKREFTTPDKLIKERLLSLSLGKQLGEEVKKGFRIIFGPALFKKENALALTLFFDRRPPWEW